MKDVQSLPIETVISTGHTSYLTGMAVSPNGLYLATAARADIKLWELSTGYLIRTFIDLGLYIDFHSNGKLISIGKDGVRLIDIETGQDKQVTENLGMPLGLRYLGDNQVLVVNRKGLEILDLLNPSESVNLFSTKEDDTKISSYDLNTSANVLVVGFSDGTVRLWNLKGQKLFQQFRVSGGEKQLIGTGRGDHEFEEELPVRRIAIDPSDTPKYIITATDLIRIDLPPGSKRRAKSLGKLVRWSMSTEGFVEGDGYTFPGRYLRILSLSVNTSGSLLVSYYFKEDCSLWALDGEHPTKLFKLKTEDGVAIAKFIEEDKHLVCGLNGGQFQLWNSEAMIKEGSAAIPVRASKNYSSAVLVTAMSRERRYLFQLTNRQPGLIAWDLERGKRGNSFDLESAKVIIRSRPPFALSSDQKIMAWGSRRRAYLWKFGASGLELIYERKFPKATVCSLAFSEDGSYLALGMQSREEIKVYVLALDSLELELKIQRPNGNLDLQQLAMSTAFNCLILAYRIKKVGTLTSNTGNPTQDSAPSDLEFYDLKTKKSTTVRAHQRRIVGLQLTKDGATAVTAGEDGAVSCWDLSTVNLEESNKRSFMLPEGLRIRRFDLSSSGQYLLAGGRDNNAYLIDLESGELVQTYITGHESSINVAFSADENFILSCSYDTKTKIWDRVSGKEIATLLNIGEADWVVLTPSGLFDASPGAMNKLHFVVGLETIDLDQLKKRYYEPGLLTMLLAGKQDQIRDVSVFASAPLFPNIIKAEIDQEGTLRVELEERSGGLGKVWLKINGKEVIEDANPDRRETFSVALEPYKQHFHPASWDNQIDIIAFNKEGWLRSRPHTISEYWPSFVSGKAGRRARQKHKEAESGRDQQLFAVFIGTSNYKIKSLALDYPDLDAARLAKALELSGQALFKNTYIRQFVSAPDPMIPQQAMANKENIKEAFEEFGQLARPRDVLVIFLSGHGETYGSDDDAEFFYLMKDLPDLNMASEKVREVGTLSTSELTSWIKGIAARKQVLILDACHSGGFTKSFGKEKSLGSTQQRALEEMKDRTGMWVLAGSADGKESFENYALGQGLLTYSLLKGIKGGALRSDDETPLIDVQLLLGYAMQEVPNLAKRAGRNQVPVLSVPQDGGQSFSLGLAKEEIRKQIELPSPKPTLVRTNFIHQSEYYDTLKLSDELDRRFKLEQTKWLRKNDQANYLFINEKFFPGAFKICGIYEKKGDVYEVKGRLLEGQNPVQETAFTVQGTTVQQLAEILEEKLLALLETNK